MHKKNITLQKKDNKRKPIMMEPSDKNAIRRYKQIMAELKEQRLHYKIQLVAIKKRKIVLPSDDSQYKN